jgi:CrcB protein
MTHIFAIDPALQATIAVSLGAIPGALSRYYLTLHFAKQFGTTFPYGTLFVNVTGTATLGFFSTLMVQQSSYLPGLQELITIGFLGAYTTFSTYALDTAKLLQARHYKNAMLYWWGSPALGFLSAELGIILAQQLS